MKNLLKIIVLSTILTGLTNCGQIENTECDLITIFNESNDTIVALLTFNYPDTLIPKQGALSYITLSSLPKYKAYTITTISTTRDEFFAQNDTAQVFVLKEKHLSLLLKKGVDYVNNNHLVLKRYEFTREDLTDLDWVVTYP